MIKSFDRIEMTLSIDIGTVNFCYVILTETTLHWELCSIGDKNVRSRCMFVHEVFRKAFSIEPSISKVVIERQVYQNVTAMYLMYACYATALEYTDNVVLFNPCMKFKMLNIQYSSVNKAHKRLCVTLASNLISEHYTDMIEEFNALRKKDDVSDAFVQAWVLMNGGTGC